MFEIFFGALLLAFALGGIWAYTFSRKVKKEGIKTEAVISRIEEHEWAGETGEFHDSGDITREYYITYTGQDGKQVEAMLTNTGGQEFSVGARVVIKYLPNRQDYPVFLRLR